MSVIINDFETMPEAAAPAESEDGQQQAPPTRSELPPLELEDLLERQAVRADRLRAH